MKIEFRECDFFDLWIWVEFNTPPAAMEQQYLEEVFSSWFLLGKLGGFNAENLQVQEAGVDISYLDYRDDTADHTFMALMHNIGDVEYRHNWARCWFDLGTTDALALDVLLNALQQLNKDYVMIDRVIVGGENADWRIPGTRRSDIVESSEDTFN